MKLSIGMATYDDYDGVYFTIQALRTYHSEVMSEVEIVVVDNHPGTETGKFIDCLLKPTGMGKGLANTKYVPMESPIGTTQPRNRIFEEADGEYVLVLDSHVLLAPGSLARLLAYYVNNPQTPDLLSGPILYDDFSICGTHFDDFWRSEMWGIWGKAWVCPCGKTPFTVINTNGRATYHKLGMGLEHCPPCCKPWPDLPHPNHEYHLTFAGFNQLGLQDKPFEIPGMGLGLFSCRREAWLGFNPHFRGFGGEEMYIHEKFRQAGAKCLCLPWLKWGHRFGRPNGTPYIEVCTKYNKVRNYVLGLQELGLPLDRLYQHFIIDKDENGQHRFPRGQFGYILSDPIGHDQPFYPPGISPPKNSGPAVISNTMKEMLGASNAG